MSLRQPTLAAALLAILAIVASGCFDSRVVDVRDAATDGGPRVDPAVVRAAREALERVADEMCRHAVDCDARYGPDLFLHDWLCQPEFRDIDDRVAAIERGAAALDAEALASCLAFLESVEGCFEGSRPDTGDPCRNLVRGTPAIGQACGASWCAEPGYCEPCTRVCTRSRLEGESCGSGARCATELACIDGICVPLLSERSRALGQSCSSDYHCPVEALCVDEGCRLPSDTVVGAPCFEGRWCSEGQWCSFDTSLCEAPSPEGGACRDEGSCETGLVCLGRICHAPRGLDESCEESADCGPDAPYCVPLFGSGTCQPDAAGMRCWSSFAISLYVPPTGCPEDYSCVPREEWLGSDGECRRSVELGAACTTTYACGGSARCISGACRAIAHPGEPCDAERVCPASFACAGGRCVLMPRVGDPCGDDLPCRSGTCREGTCALFALGEPCTESILCRDGWCSDGVCTAFRVAGPGEPCSEGVTCGESAHCNLRLGVCIAESPCPDEP